MLDDLKAILNKVEDSMEDVSDKIEDKAEDFTEETKLLWDRSKKHLANMKHSLKEASQKLETKTDEAALQAHLATMDAHDQWQFLKHNVAIFWQQAESKSQPVIDHAKLQAHLASLDARDFMASSGQTLKVKFTESKQSVEKASLIAATDIKNNFGKLLSSLPKNK